MGDLSLNGLFEGAFLFETAVLSLDLPLFYYYFLYYSSSNFLYFSSSNFLSFLSFKVPSSIPKSKAIPFWFC